MAALAGSRTSREPRARGGAVAEGPALSDETGMAGMGGSSMARAVGTGFDSGTTADSGRARVSPRTPRATRTRSTAARRTNQRFPDRLRPAIGNASSCTARGRRRDRTVSISRSDAFTRARGGVPLITECETSTAGSAVSTWMRGGAAVGPTARAIEASGRARPPSCLPRTLSVNLSAKRRSKLSACSISAAVGAEVPPACGSASGAGLSSMADALS